MTVPCRKDRLVYGGPAILLEPAGMACGQTMTHAAMVLVLIELINYTANQNKRTNRHYSGSTVNKLCAPSSQQKSADEESSRVGQCLPRRGFQGKGQTSEIEMTSSTGTDGLQQKPNRLKKLRQSAAVPS